MYKGDCYLGQVIKMFEYGCQVYCVFDIVGFGVVCCCFYLVQVGIGGKIWFIVVQENYVGFVGIGV